MSSLSTSVALDPLFSLSASDSWRVIQIPEHRKPIGHLPEALKKEKKITFPNGRELSVQEIAPINDQGHIAKIEELFDCGDNEGVQWSYDNGTCYMQSAYLGTLPTWVKIGPESAWIDKEKGIPTMQACKAILYNTLQLKGKVNRIVLTSLNPQTQLEMNLCLLKGSSLEEASVQTQSAYLAAELGEMLGGKVRLIRAENISKITCETTKETLAKSLFTEDLPAGKVDTFFKQEKFFELQNLMDPDKKYAFVIHATMVFEFISESVLPIKLALRS